jgi:hypothetical protein
MAQTIAAETQETQQTIGHCTACGVSTALRCDVCGILACGTCTADIGVAGRVYVFCAGCFALARGDWRNDALRKVTEEEISQAYDRLWWPSPMG